MTRQPKVSKSSGASHALLARDSPGRRILPGCFGDLGCGRSRIAGGSKSRGSRSGRHGARNGKQPPKLQYLGADAGLTGVELQGSPHGWQSMASGQLYLAHPERRILDQPTKGPRSASRAASEARWGLSWKDFGRPGDYPIRDGGQR